MPTIGQCEVPLITRGGGLLGTIVLSEEGERLVTGWVLNDDTRKLRIAFDVQRVERRLLDTGEVILKTQLTLACVVPESQIPKPEDADVRKQPGGVPG